MLGGLAGLLAGFANRWLDDTLAALLDILIAFPTLLLAMLVVAARGASLGSAIVAIGLAMSAIVARLTRVLVKRVLAMDYVTAARTSGVSWPRIVTAHVLPNIWPTLAVNLALQFGLAVLAEASLSYLGLGPPPPNASWGRLLQEAQSTVLDRAGRRDRTRRAPGRARGRRQPARRRAARRGRPDPQEAPMSLLDVTDLTVTTASGRTLVDGLSFAVVAGRSARADRRVRIREVADHARRDRAAAAWSARLRDRAARRDTGDRCVATARSTACAGGSRRSSSRSRRRRWTR